jgi:hypothetical protein
VFSSAFIQSLVMKLYDVTLNNADEVEQIGRSQVSYRRGILIPELIGQK